MAGKRTLSSLVDARVNEWERYFTNKLASLIQRERCWLDQCHLYGDGAYCSLGWKRTDGNYNIDDKLNSFYQLFRPVQLLLILLPILFAIVISLNRCFQQNRSVVKPGIT
jgi:hypothetical protein